MSYRSESRQILVTTEEDLKPEEIAALVSCFSMVKGVEVVAMVDPLLRDRVIAALRTMAFKLERNEEP